MKIIQIKEEEEERAKLMNELTIMKSLSHYNITNYIDHFIINKKFLCIVMDCARCGNLRNFIAANAFYKTRVSEDFAMSIFSQIVLGMAYIHSKKIIHRDLKPENILFDEGGRILISDFGLSKGLSSISMKVTSVVGSIPYMPPEMLVNEAY